MSKYYSLAAFIGSVVGIGWIIGYLNIPGEWYAALAKPSFNPPNWVFGPMWTFLYILIAIAGWRTWRREGFNRAFKLWLAQMALNFMWSPVFFGLQQMEAALAILAAMLMTIIAFFLDRLKHDRTSAWLFAPYIAWVAFAGLLNTMLVVLN